jgi:hypothetical protein
MPFLVDGTLGGTFPSWTTATRPASPAVGQMGYNTTIGQFDMYTASGWVSSLTNASQSIPFAALPTGSVLQVVQGSFSTFASTTSGTYVDTGLTASITPKYSSSKILAMVNQNFQAQISTGGDAQGCLNLCRNGTAIFNPTVIFDQWRIQAGSSGSGTSLGGPFAITYLDSPASTSSVVYKTQMALKAGTGVFTQVSGETSIIILMEIAA